MGHTASVKAVAGHKKTNRLHSLHLAKHCKQTAHDPPAHKLRTTPSPRVPALTAREVQTAVDKLCTTLARTAPKTPLWAESASPHVFALLAPLEPLRRLRRLCPPLAPPAPFAPPAAPSTAFDMRRPEHSAGSASGTLWAHAVTDARARSSGYSRPTVLEPVDRL